MTDFVEIPDDNSSDNEIQEQQSAPAANHAFDELRTLKSEMEFRGSLLGKTWSELSNIMTRYQSQLITKHEQLDASLSEGDHFKITQIEQKLKKYESENERLQKNVTDLESKILEKDSEIVTLRTEVHKFRNEVSMKDNLIQKIQAQMAQEAMDYQSEITSLRDMLEGGQGDYGANVGPVPVSAPQPIKRRKILPKPMVVRQPIATLGTPVKSPQTFQAQRIPTSAPSPSKIEQSSSTPIKSESFQSSCQMSGPSSSQTGQNEMDSSFSADQNFDVSQDDSQNEGYYKVDEVYDNSNSGDMEGLMQGQDGSLLLEGMQGQEQNVELLRSLRRFEMADQDKKQCEYCNNLFSNSSHLKRHIRNIHFGEKPYQCLICLRTFARKENTTSHIINKHQRDDPGPLVAYKPESTVAYKSRLTTAANEPSGSGSLE